MPWLAARLDGHPHHVDAGSQRETVFRRLGYVEVAAPDAPEPAAPVDDFGDPIPDVHGQEAEPGETFDDGPSVPDRS